MPRPRKRAGFLFLSVKAFFVRPFVVSMPPAAVVVKGLPCIDLIFFKKLFVKRLIFSRAYSIIKKKEGVPSKKEKNYDK